jgi:polar amino acid transport system substrate-binding protein
MTTTPGTRSGALLNRRALAGAAALPFLTLSGLTVSGFGLTGSAHAQSTAESTFDRVRRTKVLRIAALPGELPYFAKDITSGEWSGSCIEMAKDIAKVFDAKLEYVESTYGNSVLDLQSNKVDLAFALNPTPARALSIGFTHPMIIHPFGCVARKGLAPKTWSDINKPDIKIVYDIGSLHETAAKRYCQKAQLTGFKSRDECLLNLQSGRADVHILAAILGLSEVGKNPAIGAYYLLTEPLVALPSCLGIQREADIRFQDVMNAWLDMARGSGQIREWMLEGLAKAGASPDLVPAALTF